jgi:predicted phosphate transport protein (TIGR00153 family)
MGLIKIKKSVNFFEMLTEQASLTVAGVQALCDYCDDPTEEKGAKVKEYEVKADTARRLLISEINKTFITPIDREDLFDLSSAIDDIIDYAATTIEELGIYKLKPDNFDEEMSDIILKQTSGILKAVTFLERNKDMSSDEAVKIKKLENKANELYHKALSELFDSDDIKKILKTREIYRHLNNAADKGDHAADVLLNIIVKM